MPLQSYPQDHTATSSSLSLSNTCKNKKDCGTTATVCGVRIFIFSQCFPQLERSVEKNSCFICNIAEEGFCMIFLFFKDELPCILCDCVVKH